MKNDFNTALDYEASFRYLIEQSNKRAWLISFVAIFIASLSLIAVVLLTPLKTIEPYVIRVDNTTGMVDILTLLDEKEITQNEALDKYFISQYIKAREGYYYELLNQDYLLTQLMSSENVANEYRALYEGDNARDQILKNSNEVSVQILSVVLGESNGVKTSTIRANITTKNLSSRGTSQATKVITLSYDYTLGKASEENRLLNPLGFKVLTYRIDNEVEK
ncbi:type IV secretion system protein [Campylobacter upsaliensis]|uniref:Type IV secretion system protein n=1 Tax=Campylobacter upsaliensis TaxID=28080 RepID=A0A5L8VFK2_CAMUP|nr:MULTISPECIES: type IV secretion system protein [Campylobacter]EAW7484883.1 type IV secretion system protein [Campylobacter jejuni]EAH5982819.1 type IV secretion system protein [Campylobacter upsaliensis]EAI0016431.1 type IV secretion system protein [Campylobacter upsaliensis]EAI1980797.1 type IV secretion system protein [Campylobacter upsaliensis]EAI2045437.1 type IV secretion system protein [Campylobacter upsaliensis]